MEQNKNREINSFKNIVYIFKLLWKASPFRIFATLFKTIAEQVFQVFFFVYLTQYIFTAIETKKKYSDFMIMIGLACLLHIVLQILTAWYNYYTAVNDPKVSRYVYDMINEKVKEIPLTKFEQPDFYDKYTRALNEAVTRAFTLLDTIAAFLAVCISAVCTMLLIINVDWILLLFSIVPIVSSYIIGNKNSKLWYKMDLEKTRSNRIVGYAKRVFYEKKYAGELRLYNIKELLLKKHKGAFDNMYKLDKKYRKTIAFLNVINQLSFNLLMYFGSIIYIIFRVTSGNAVLVAPYIAMINAISSMADNIEGAIYKFIDITKQSLYIQNLRDFLEYECKSKDCEYVPITQPIDEIEFKNVCYTYEGAEKPVINNLSLHIHKGEKIALVGYNGAGKTTIVKLLMGLYNVTSGEIIAGGNNISSYESKDYYKRFGVIFQDFQIFALPLVQNVLMKNAENEDERNCVIEALEKAQFGDKLRKLPMGIDTMVTNEFDENGMGLSGGEAQKIAIARVFAKDCDIAILDEPSSALDPIAEFNMYNNMMEASKNKTVIFISHRLSSARMADKIYMLEKGSIIEQGTHSELMELNKKYAEMFNLQAKNYKEEEAMRYE